MKANVNKIEIKKQSAQLTISIDIEKYNNPDNSVIELMTIAMLSGASCNSLKQLFENVEIDFNEIHLLQEKFNELAYYAEKCIKSKGKLKIKDKHTFI